MLVNESYIRTGSSPSDSNSKSTSNATAGAGDGPSYSSWYYCRRWAARKPIHSDDSDEELELSQATQVFSEEYHAWRMGFYRSNILASSTEVAQSPSRSTIPEPCYSHNDASSRLCPSSLHSVEHNAPCEVSDPAPLAASKKSLKKGTRSKKEKTPKTQVRTPHAKVSPNRPLTTRTRSNKGKEKEPASPEPTPEPIKIRLPIDLVREICRKELIDSKCITSSSKGSLKRSREAYESEVDSRLSDTTSTPTPSASDPPPPRKKARIRTDEETMKRGQMTPSQRYYLLFSDPTIVPGSIECQSVCCVGCGKRIRLETAGDWYCTYWWNHRGRCLGLEMTGLRRIAPTMEERKEILKGMPVRREGLGPI